MLLTLQLSKLTLFCALVTSSVCFAADEKCPQVGSSDSPVRQLNNQSLSIELKKQGDQWSACVGVNQCRWGPLTVSQQQLAGLGPYASQRDGTCWTSYS